MLSAAAFQRKIWQYYRAHKRELPWRDTKNPYCILVSEVMLQQTQVTRVMPKYAAFLKHFPTLQKLAAAPLSDVLRMWQGLGYNRRALMLQQAAQVILKDYKGKFPSDYRTLLELPGVGPSTAAGIMNFAFGVPTPYLETNVRSVYLHFFFGDARCELVNDKEILPLLEKTIDRKNSRDWFYALLDYGVMIKKIHGNPNIRSKHYAKQSPFEGSTRQAGARVLREALKAGVAEKKLIKLLSS